jgi:hypothetical protein
MAAKTPVSVGTTGHVDPDRGIYTHTGAATEVVLTNGSKDDNRLRFIQKIYYFSDIDDGDTWASGIAGIKACFWMGDDVDTDAACASAAATGVVTFETAAASDINGWLLLFIDPITSGLSGLRQL